MLKRHFLRACLALLSLSLWASSSQAAESYDNCTGTITSLPAVISTQGTWCMNADLATAITSGNAVSVTTNNVTINCNDFKLGGLSAGTATQAVGVNASNRLNVTVRNCNIRGFQVGALLKGGGHVVEDSRFDANTIAAVDVEGDGSAVRRNRISDTGGSTALIATTAYGIATVGGVDIIDNTISGVYPPAGSNAYGIYASTAWGSSIRGNRIRGLVKNGPVGNGIATVNSAYVVLADNVVVGDGATGSVGLACDSASVSSMRNSTGAFPTGTTICTNAGGNFNTP